MSSTIRCVVHIIRILVRAHVWVTAHCRFLIIAHSLHARRRRRHPHSRRLVSEPQQVGRDGARPAGGDGTCADTVRRCVEHFSLRRRHVDERNCVSLISSRIVRNEGSIKLFIHATNYACISKYGHRETETGELESERERRDGQTEVISFSICISHSLPVSETAFVLGVFRSDYAASIRAPTTNFILCTTKTTPSYQREPPALPLPPGPLSTAVVAARC